MGDEAEKDSDDAILKQAKTDFERFSDDGVAQNRDTYTKDTRFVRLREQWPDDIKDKRKGRPMLTIDRLGQVVRQVVNDSRQNKPSIKVHPVDSSADVKTAGVIDGLIRNIEYSSNADVAYDTAVECAVGGGFGYFRIGANYSHDDTFEMDLSIERIADPLCVYPDPDSTAADSSDWNKAFIVTHVSKDEYETKYAGEEKVNWSDDHWKGWLDDEGVLIADYWVRKEYDKVIVKTTDGKTYDKELLTTDPDLSVALEQGLIQIATDKTGKPVERTAKCYRLTQYKLSGAKVLETIPSPGQYIPIIPVYGDEFWVDGVRYLRSLINPAKEGQVMFNVMRSVSVELWGLSPKVPFIGPIGAFNTDVAKWNTANTEAHPYIEYDGLTPPIRLPLDPGPASGAMSEALAAADDIKSATGIYDASLGQRSNETSGRAIMARQREGDTSTFHFIDNLRRAIRHAGRVLIDLIPHYYDTERIVRVIGEDGKEEAVQINAPTKQMDPKGQPMVDEMGQAVMAMHDLTVGKYDVTVSSGPSFTTRREEAAYSMTEALRAFPDGADIIMPELAKNLDWPGADKIAEKLEAKMSGQLPPEVQKMVEEGKAVLEESQQKIQELEQQLAAAQQDQQVEMANVQSDAEIAKFKAELDAQTKLSIAQINARVDAQVATFKAKLDAQAQAQRPIVQAQPRKAA